MKAHFVTFCSPGTLFAEETTKSIPSWDTELAKKMSKSITERYNQKPFCFVFSTRARNNKELDSKVVKTSPRHYLGGKLMTLKEIEAELGEDSILAGNMRCNNWKQIIKCPAGNYQPFEKGDKIV